MNDLAIFLVAQSVIIIGAIVTVYVRIAVSLAVLKADTKTLKTEHIALSSKVSGISRAVGRLEGRAEK